MTSVLEKPEEKVGVCVKLRRQQLAVLDRVARASELNRSSLLRQIIATWAKEQEKGE